jgi:hypothetical protein
MTLKLYKRINNILHYWETWYTDEDTAIIHWGVVGETGEDKEVKSTLFSNYKKIVDKEINKKMQEGYAEVEADDMDYFEVEYQVDGFGTEEDLAKRDRVENKLNELLGWTGLGHVDGASIGSGSMEVDCATVDFEIAKRVIENDFKDTELGDFFRIYKTNDD